jgi:hypothetical protein
MADTDGKQAPEAKSFTPKQKIELDPPKDDLITYEELSECDGTLRCSKLHSRTLTTAINV